MGNDPVKIGVLIAPLAGNYDTRALQYLILSMNGLQNSFEYHILPYPKSKYIEKLSYDKTVDPAEIQKSIPTFLEKYRSQLIITSKKYGLSYEDNIQFVFLSAARFNDDSYQTGSDDWTIFALGNWERAMAPPSIIAFFLSMLVRASIDKACNGFFPARHLGIKGCCFDYTVQIEEARNFVLSGFICGNCRPPIERSANRQVWEDASLLLKRTWLGSASEPSDVALTARNLGHDFFHTMGITPTLKERFCNLFAEVAAQGFIKVFFVVFGAALLLIIGLK